MNSVITNNQPTIEDVKNFWNTYPLFSQESKFKPATKEFFQEHEKVVLEDYFAGVFKDELFFPANLSKDARILDLGCGIGFWTIEFLKRGYKNLYAADLAQSSLEITKKHLEIYNLKADLSIQNAENTTFKNDFFDHVNCQGVIHHTPDTQACIGEIARILKKGGTACISVYYRNIFLKIWPILSIVGPVLCKLGFGLKGIGRESIFLERNPDKIIKLFDGENNPIGKSYTKSTLFNMARPYFSVQKIYLSLFPSRALPFGLPRLLHSFLSKHYGFMIHLNLVKK